MNPALPNLLGAGFFLFVALGMLNFYNWKQLPGEDELRYRGRMTLYKFGVFGAVTTAILLFLTVILPVEWSEAALRWVFRRT